LDKLCGIFADKDPVEIEDLSCNLFDLNGTIFINHIGNRFIGSLRVDCLVSNLVEIIMGFFFLFELFFFLHLFFADDVFLNFAIDKVS